MPAAKGRGKTRSWLTKNQDELHDKKVTRPLRRRRTNILQRVQSRKAYNVDDILYGFLGDLAAVSDKRRYSKMKHFRVPNARIRRSGRAGNKPRKEIPKKKMSSTSFALSDSSKSIFETTEDNGSMSTAMESATRPSSACSASTFCSEPPVPVDSKQGVKDLLKKNSLIEILKNYIKVGIKADEQRAKSYMKKAITFGVNSGFLKPVDDSGHLLEISSKLPGIKINVKRDIVEERRRRKNMRRGIVNFDDYDMKPVKKRNSSKLDHEKRQKEVKTITSKKRARSTARNSKSAKGEARKREKNPPAKKKAKIANEPIKSQRNTRNNRRNRSPTPWRSTRKSPSEEQNSDSPCDNREDFHQDKNKKKGRNVEKNDLKEKTEKRREASSPSREEDGKNHVDDSSMPENIGENLNLIAEPQMPIESAQEHGDKP